MTLTIKVGSIFFSSLVDVSDDNDDLTITTVKFAERFNRVVTDAVHLTTETTVKLTNNNIQIKYNTSNIVSPALMQSIDLCHSSKSTDSLPIPSDSKILLIGASSFIGINIAREFHERKIPVIPTEDNVNIGFDPLTWYRWEKLMGMGISPMFFNYSDHDMTESLVKEHSPRAIVYIPTPLFEGQESDSNVRHIIELYENFLLLLEIVRNVFPTTLIVLISSSEPSGTHRIPWIKVFELSLSSYQHLYNINTAVIKTKGVYGPWQSEDLPSDSDTLCYIGDVVKKVDEVVTKQRLHCIVYDNIGCNISLENGISQTKQWIEEYSAYRKQQTKDIIASTYFTTKRNAQYPIEFINDNYYFMENWFKGVYKLNANIVVFHDALSDKFVSTFEKNYPKADFVKIKDFKDYRPNDRQYLALYDYILAHPEIKRIVRIDMRDLVIQNDPFEMMDVLGNNHPYIGMDRPFFDTSIKSSVAGVFRRCFDKGKYALDYHEELLLHGFYNSGVLGGSRPVILAYLTRFLAHFQISNKDNCNMALAGYIFHKFYFDIVINGWPINMAFLTDQPNIPGLCILHKWDLNSWN